MTPVSGGERGTDRDRDAAGRPRNARARDGLGRPLSRSADDPGMPRIPDDMELPVMDAVVLADRLLRDGQPFHAHEVLEAVWKTGPAPERDLWQGLAQIAVGITHARRGNARGAVALLRRGADRTAGYPPRAHGVMVARVAQAAETLASRIERDGLATIPDGDWRIGLT